MSTFSRIARVGALCAVAAVYGTPAVAQPVQPVPAPSPLSSPSESPAVPVSPSALPPAGTIPSAITLNVTGMPADGNFLETQIYRSLDRLIRPTLRAGASVRFGTIVPWPLPALSPDGRAEATVAVTIAGDSTSAWVSAVTTVDMTNVGLTVPGPSVLYLSDDPEYVNSVGLLFRGTVTAARAARMYYYHADVGLPHDLDVVLTATKPSRVHVMQSAAGPDLDVMSVGHTVSRDSLLYQMQHEGVIADVVPGVPYVLRHDLMLQGELIAGSTDVAVLSGGPVTVSVVSSLAGGSPDAYLNGPRLAFDGHNRHGAFDLDGFGDLEGDYTVGGPDVAVKYGSSKRSPRNLDPADSGHDWGDYGVVHRIKFTLTNPTDTPQPVYMYEKPLGGPVRSSFIVDGQLKEVGCVRVAQPYWFMTYQLAPHSTSASTTLTMTDGGSFYPLEFGVSGTMPFPYTPRVGSANGCSPTVAPTASRPPPAPSPTMVPVPPTAVASPWPTMVPVPPPAPLTTPSPLATATLRSPRPI